MSEIDLVLDGDEAFVNGELLGVDIVRTASGLVKRSHTEIEKRFLMNEFDKLHALAGTGFVPSVLGIDLFGKGDMPAMIREEDLGESEPVTDETIFRRNCALLLWTLKKHGVRHGDISTKNIIVKNNKPMLIDFHQSKFDHESGPEKRPEGDAFNLWEAALELSPDTSRHIRKWRAIRPFVKSSSLIDFGCAEGDYLLFALTEIMSWDMGRFWGMDQDVSIPNYGNDALKQIWLDGARDSENILWPVVHQDCISYVDTVIKHKHLNNAFFMSVFAHIVKNEGFDIAKRTLVGIVEMSKQLFFETQLYGDGPGPEFFQTDDDVFNFLKQFGKVEKLVTIPVHGRDASRTVWRII